MFVVLITNTKGIHLVRGLYPNPKDAALEVISFAGRHGLEARLGDLDDLVTGKVVEFTCKDVWIEVQVCAQAPFEDLRLSEL